MIILLVNNLINKFYLRFKYSYLFNKINNRN